MRSAGDLDSWSPARWKERPIRHLTLTIAPLLLLVGCEPPERSPVTRGGTVYVVPMGDAPEAEVRRAVWALEAATRDTRVTRAVHVLPRIGIPRAARLSNGRYDAGVLLDTLLLNTPPDTFRVTGVASVPLSAVEHGPVIGYARRGERALVYSTQALPAFTTEAGHRRRVRRILTHELGHTHGAGHCESRCVLAGISSPGGIELLADGYCPEHRVLARSALALGPGHPEFELRVGAERMRLGRWGEAVDAYRLALEANPRDARIRTSLGVALMGHGEYLAAEQAFVEASGHAPDAPQPFYGRAVLHAVQETHRASAYLEAAVRRDGNARSAHRAAGILYQDLMANDQQAIRHYSAHLRLGGRDPIVLGRLVKLLAPTTLVIQEPELVIARWQPGQGLVLASARPR